MSTDSWKIPLLELPQTARTKVIRKIRERLRQKMLEAKMWHELLQVDNLTINGKVVWTERQTQTRFYARNRPKR